MLWPRINRNDYDMAMNNSSSYDTNAGYPQEIDVHPIITIMFNPIFNSFIGRYISTKPIEIIRTGGLMEVRDHGASPLYRIAVDLDTWRYNLVRKGKISFSELENEIGKLINIYEYAIVISLRCKLNVHEERALNELLQHMFPEFFKLFDNQFNTNFSEKIQLILQKFNEKETYIESYIEVEKQEQVVQYAPKPNLTLNIKSYLIKLARGISIMDEVLATSSLSEERPVGLSFLVIFNYVFGFILLTSVFFTEPSTASKHMVFGLIHLFTAWGLYSGKKWAWWILATLLMPYWFLLISSLFGVIPSLLVISILYYYLFKPFVISFFRIILKFSFKRNRV